MANASFTDNDAIYLWRAEGVQHNGTPVYKIGMTSARLGNWRIGHVAKASGFTPTVLRHVKVTEKATFIECRLLEMGIDPGYTGFAGCTEFRALTDQQADFIIGMIDMYADESPPVENPDTQLCDLI